MSELEGGKVEAVKFSVESFLPVDQLLNRPMIHKLWNYWSDQWAQIRTHAVTDERERSICLIDSYLNELTKRDNELKTAMKKKYNATAKAKYIQRQQQKKEALMKMKQQEEDCAQDVKDLDLDQEQRKKEDNDKREREQALVAFALVKTDYERVQRIYKEQMSQLHEELDDIDRSFVQPLKRKLSDLEVELSCSQTKYVKLCPNHHQIKRTLFDQLALPPSRMMDPCPVCQCAHPTYDVMTE